MSTVSANMNVRSDTTFVPLTACTWLLFFYLVQPEYVSVERALHAFAFATGAGFISFLLLKLLGYFDLLRLVPRKSDLLLVLMALPLGGLILYSFFYYFTGESVCSFDSILYATPVLTLIVFGAHYLGTKVLLARGQKRKVVLDVLPQEAEILTADFQGRGMNKYLEILSRRDLQAHLRAGDTRIDLIIISRRAAQQFQSNPWLIRAHLAGIPIADYRSVTAGLSGRCRLADADLWSYVLSARPQTQMLRLYSAMKRIVEPVLALLLGLLLSPLMILIALMIRRTSPGPILYKQVRAGYLGRPFTLFKFRSMYSDSEKNGPQWAARDDSRITPIGRILRATRLDELPQLWNVVRGEMSFCGPRPERPEIYARLEDQIPLFSFRTIVRPGITGWAQVFAGYAASVEESLLKLEYDLYYIQHMSPRLDIIIVLKTIFVAVCGDARNEQRAAAAPRMIPKPSSASGSQANGLLEAANG